MNTARISPKFQVIIPQKVRKALSLKSGQKMQIFTYGNRIELIPERDVADMKGFLKGINTNLERKNIE